MMGHLRVSSLLNGCTLEGIWSINQPTNSKRPSMNDCHHAMRLILNHGRRFIVLHMESME